MVAAQLLRPKGKRLFLCVGGLLLICIYRESCAAERRGFANLNDDDAQPAVRLAVEKRSTT